MVTHAIGDEDVKRAAIIAVFAKEEQSKIMSYFSKEDILSI